jgi:hypothetical protein
MDRLMKLELIQRTLGIRHKLKVHESMKTPDTHEDLAVMLMAKWELEDELRAIEEILAGERQRNVLSKRTRIEKEGPRPPKLPPEPSEDEAPPKRKGRR